MKIYMASYYDEIEDIANYETPVVVPDFDLQAKVLHKCTKFKPFFDSLGLTEPSCFEVTKATLHGRKSTNGPLRE